MGRVADGTADRSRRGLDNDRGVDHRRTCQPGGFNVGVVGAEPGPGARTPVIWFKICPVLLTASAVLLVIASFS